MPLALLLQLPIPRRNFGRRGGNIPLAAACLKQACHRAAGWTVEVFPERLSSHLGDAALIELLAERSPEVLGFTVHAWSRDRVLHIAEAVKRACGARVVLGGPEITPDAAPFYAGRADFLVFGEGEAIFRRLLSDPDAWKEGRGSEPAEAIFRSAPSPYLNGLLDPEDENLMLLETQRGCPYRCGFCFYHKSRRGMAFAEPARVLEAAAWAIERGVGEIYVLDPSLNCRPDLHPLLAAIARLNAARRVSLFSEIRAEAVDDELADLLAAAGFRWFEIGLQSSNPAALRRIGRPTRLEGFLGGVRRLKARGITPCLDLIVGLPGDDLPGFRRSVDFIAEHGLNEDVQVFPLAVLPGTEFRARSRELGLHYTPEPPYTVTRTEGFGPEELLAAWDYAEDRLQACFFPPPELDPAWRIGDSGGDPAQARDLRVRFAEAGDYLVKLLLPPGRPVEEIRRLARRLTQPYQILVPPGTPFSEVRRTLSLTTEANPFVPLEVIFFEPREIPPTRDLLAALKLRRPHFLDGDLRFQFPAPGNRAVWFTLVSEDPEPRYRGETERQVLWWRRSALPGRIDLRAAEDLDGVLIDSRLPVPQIEEFQDRMAGCAEELTEIAFGDVLLQRRWLRLTHPGDYAAQAPAWESGDGPQGRGDRP